MLSCCRVLAAHTDDRVLVQNTTKGYHLSVAHLSLEFANKEIEGKKVLFNGTGFLCQFMGRAILMTAKHCVLDSKKKQRVGKVRVYFGRNGKEKPVPCIPLDGSRFKWHPERDVAFADLSDLDLQLPTSSFEIDSYKAGLHRDATIEIVGYPGEKCTENNRRAAMCRGPWYTQWKVRGPQLIIWEEMSDIHR